MNDEHTFDSSATPRRVVPAVVETPCTVLAMQYLLDASRQHGDLIVLRFPAGDEDAAAQAAQRAAQAGFTEMVDHVYDQLADAEVVSYRRV